MSDGTKKLKDTSQKEVKTWCENKDKELQLIELKRNFKPELHKLGEISMNLDAMSMKKVLGAPASYDDT